jgi:Domain of unknown function (DUF5063)
LGWCLRFEGKGYVINDDFVDQARQFCEFLQRSDALSLSERLSTARTRLLELYRAGVAPPQVEASEGDAAPNPEKPSSWAGFGDFEFYAQVFDPYAEGAPVTGSLSDDLLDVYFDVRRGLDLWDRDERAAAIWESRFHFDTHWGAHAIDALRALHRACGHFAGATTSSA